MFGFWAPTEFQETLESSIRKQVVEEMAEAGFTPTPDQIMNKLKKKQKKTEEGLLRQQKRCFAAIVFTFI